MQPIPSTIEGALPLVAISTVEIRALGQATTALQDRLGHLLEALQTGSGCTAYSLARSTSCPRAWILTGYWSALAPMRAHFELPCLKELFALTRERLADRLRFATFELSLPPLEERPGR
ncbi:MULTISPECIES: antibiotic biosynthesis monooxygenase [Pseudomonas]|uniref:antibiotic biosynthesis monooxygenase n=1 Tax=Pseudomonas TaxID=286 RepID=UPI002360F8C2|nr:antibiotic biosynthesis monooxygenase [Pseudomonas asplenii]